MGRECGALLSAGVNFRMRRRAKLFHNEAYLTHLHEQYILQGGQDQSSFHKD
jgi:hypothetical protein